MKRIIVILFCLTATIATFAQGSPQKFSPEKFQADLQEYIVKEAKLTPQEAAKFLPLYSEMFQKQRAIYDRQRQLRMNGCLLPFRKFSAKQNCFARVSMLLPLVQASI